MLIIKDLMLSQLKINILYHLYMRLLNGLIKPKSILNLILLLPLTISKYRKVINGKLHLHHALANLNITILPFGICNGPGSFQSYINNALQDYLNNFCSAYMDDILIYSNNPFKHTEHV